jgi:hypothetical protein
LHVLELPKFTKQITELQSGLDIWLYFLRHAAKMDTEGLPAVLQEQPLVVRAFGELKMLTQSDLERERYEARRKAQLDYNTGMKFARLQGEQIGAIHSFEKLLNRPETPIDQLEHLSLDDLARLVDDLWEQVRKQR